MNTPWGDDGVDDSGENTTCEHGTPLLDEDCLACMIDLDRYDPDAEVKFRRENASDDE